MLEYILGKYFRIFSLGLFFLDQICNTIAH